MEEIYAYIDEEQAGDSGELYDGWSEIPSVIKEGMKLGVQLSIYCDDPAPNLIGSEISGDGEGVFEQPTIMSPRTKFSGRVVVSESSYLEPSEFVPKGRTHLQILIFAREIPVVIDYSWEGKRDVEVPNGDAFVKGEGDLHCDVAFFGSGCFSPVSSEVVKMKVFPEGDRPELVWGLAELRLREDLGEFDMFVDNLAVERKSFGVTKYSPSSSTMKKYQPKPSRRLDIRIGGKLRLAISLTSGTILFIIGISLFVSTIHLPRFQIPNSLGAVIVSYFMVLVGILLIGNSLLSALTRRKQKLGKND